MTRLDPVPPGEVLRHDFMEPFALSSTALAERRVGDALEAIRPHAVP